MRGWLLGGLSALMLMGAADAASAQNVVDPQGIPDQVHETVEDLALQIDGYLQEMWQGSPDPAPPILAPVKVLLQDVFYGLPDTEDYAFTVSFRSAHESSASGVLQEDPEHLAVLDDAAACSEAREGLPVLRFERLSIGGMTGYQCVVAGFIGDDLYSWVFASFVVLRSADRYLDIRMGAAASSETRGRDYAGDLVMGQSEELMALIDGVNALTIEAFLVASSR
jgi:hypothetical protein